MAHSLEVRHPFLDHRIVNFALNLPVELKLKNGWSKYVLRQSFPELPAKIRWRRDKQGFTTPEEAWLKKEFRELIQKTFRKSTLAEIGILDAPGFLNCYDAFRMGKPGISYADISRALIAEMWAQQYLR